jgi:glutamine amidotransferase-like uncharacterized protein
MYILVYFYLTFYCILHTCKGVRNYVSVYLDVDFVQGDQNKAEPMFSFADS